MTMYKFESKSSMRYCKQDIIHKMTGVQLKFSDDFDYLMRYAIQEINECQDDRNHYKLEKSHTYPVEGLDGLIVGRAYRWVLYDGDSYDDKKFMIEVTIEPLIEKKSYFYHD